MDYLNPVVEVLNGLSLPVKVAWAVWLAWGLGQLVWYYWEKRDPHTYRAPSRARQSEVRPVAVRPPSSKKIVAPPAAAPYGTSDFLAALDQEQAAMAGQGARESSSAYR